MVYILFKYILADDEEEEQTEASDESQQNILPIRRQESEEMPVKASAIPSNLSSLPLKITAPNLEDLQGAFVSSFGKLRSLLDRSQQSNTDITESRDKGQKADSTSSQRDQTLTASTSNLQASEVSIAPCYSKQKSSSLKEMCILEVSQFYMYLWRLLINTPCLSFT